MKSRTRHQREQPPDGGPCPGAVPVGPLAGPVVDRQTDIAYIGFGFCFLFVSPQITPHSHSWKTEVGAGGREGAGGERRPRLVSRRGGPASPLARRQGGVGQGGEPGGWGGNVTLSQGDASLQEGWDGESGWRQDGHPVGPGLTPEVCPLLWAGGLGRDSSGAQGWGWGQQSTRAHPHCSRSRGDRAGVGVGAGQTMG